LFFKYADDVYAAAATKGSEYGLHGPKAFPIASLINGDVYVDRLIGLVSYSESVIRIGKPGGNDGHWQILGKDTMLREGDDVKIMLFQSRIKQKGKCNNHRMCECKNGIMCGCMNVRMNECKDEWM
jgi:hypothetical protein